MYAMAAARGIYICIEMIDPFMPLGCWIEDTMDSSGSFATAAAAASH